MNYSQGKYLKSICIAKYHRRLPTPMWCRTALKFLPIYHSCPSELLPSELLRYASEKNQSFLFCFLFFCLFIWASDKISLRWYILKEIHRKGGLQEYIVRISWVANRGDALSHKIIIQYNLFIFLRLVIIICTFM